MRFGPFRPLVDLPPPRLLAGAAGLVACALLLVLFRHRFNWALELRDIPALAVAAGLMAAGAIYWASLAGIPALVAGGAGIERAALMLIIAAGLGARLLMLPVEPVLEDDYHRYLWDGAMVANGLNPYTVAPRDAIGLDGNPRSGLAAQSGVIVDRINHPNLRTMYPPVAEGFFALAYLIKPWSITAWRLICFAGELATLALLLALLDAIGRSRLWVIVYWWNPIAIKETINSAHMEAVLTPLVLAALLLAIRRRPLAASGMLALAIGTKLWPITLAPLILRPLLRAPRQLAVAVAVIGGAFLLSVLPLYLAGLDQTSGLRAYAEHWKTNSALFPALESLAKVALAPLSVAATTPGLLVRGSAALLLGALALWLSQREAHDGSDLLWRACLIVSGLFLLSPAQFPWYYLWCLPLLVFHPVRSMLAVTVFVPIYYASFHFHARDTYEVYRTWIVWLVWGPVWLLIARDLMSWRARRHQRRLDAR